MATEEERVVRHIGQAFATEILGLLEAITAPPAPTARERLTRFGKPSARTAT